MFCVYQHVWSPQIQAGFLLNITISRVFGECLNDWINMESTVQYFPHTLGVSTHNDSLREGWSTWIYMVYPLPTARLTMKIWPKLVGNIVCFRLCICRCMHSPLDASTILCSVARMRSQVSPGKKKLGTHTPTCKTQIQDWSFCIFFIGGIVILGIQQDWLLGRSKCACHFSKLK